MKLDPYLSRVDPGGSGQGFPRDSRGSSVYPESGVGVGPSPVAPESPGHRDRRGVTIVRVESIPRRTWASGSPESWIPSPCGSRVLDSEYSLGPECRLSTMFISPTPSPLFRTWDVSEGGVGRVPSRRPTTPSPSLPTSPCLCPVPSVSGGECVHRPVSKVFPFLGRWEPVRSPVPVSGMDPQE